MLDRLHDLDVSDDFAHDLAATIVLSERDTESIIARDEYAYRARGGKDGYLCYRKRASDNWVLIANWCFFGLYIVVRYRKPVWLRPMYRSLFARMNFVSVTFFDHSIELVGMEGETLRSRKFRLSPPSALTAVMSERFGYTQEKIEELKATLCV